MIDSVRGMKVDEINTRKYSTHGFEQDPLTASI